MKSRWSDVSARKFVEENAARWGEDLALRVYSARLLGEDPALVLHGGGNSSVKTSFIDLYGEETAGIFVKASGFDMASIGFEGFPGLDLDQVKGLRRLSRLTDAEMEKEVRRCLFDPHAATPSIEAPVHAFIPAKFIDHTHADAILTLTNQRNGRRLIEEALGNEVIVLDYVTPGFDLAKAAAEAFERHPGRAGMVWLKHGVVTWGESAQASYEAMIRLVTKAEDFAGGRSRKRFAVAVEASVAEARDRWPQIAPEIRGLLAQPTGDPDRPFRRVILQPLIDAEVLSFLQAPQGKSLALAPPLTSDHLIRTKPSPLWIDDPDYENHKALREQLSKGIEAYSSEYSSYVTRHAPQMPEGVRPFDSAPRVILMPGLGAICAGEDASAAVIARDITAHTLRAKARTAAMEGTYEGLAEDELFEMEYRTLQQAKLRRRPALPLGGTVALITGAAGAIGSAIAEALLEEGCHVAITDLPGDRLEGLVQDLMQSFGNRVTAAPLDVTSAASVKAGFDAVISTWGGIDLVIVNAGAAMVSALDEINPESFQRLERINIDGTLLVLSESARIFKRQETGGDIVLVSTKNVFAPGPRFGAYSATKAAAHQLARIASLELAACNVRVNMVAPDAVFSHGSRKSGLWAEVGPDRMKARGLSEDQLEEYYRSRNLLKARVTGRHVARAVLFFATRQTPTTGATLPVDGGLPDATPR